MSVATVLGRCKLHLFEEKKFPLLYIRGGGEENQESTVGQCLYYTHKLSPNSEEAFHFSKALHQVKRMGKGRGQ